MHRPTRAELAASLAGLEGRPPRVPVRLGRCCALLRPGREDGMLLHDAILSVPYFAAFHRFYALLASNCVSRPDFYAGLDDDVAAGRFAALELEVPLAGGSARVPLGKCLLTGRGVALLAGGLCVLDSAEFTVDGRLALSPEVS